MVVLISLAIAIITVVLMTTVKGIVMSVAVLSTPVTIATAMTSILICMVIV